MSLGGASIHKAGDGAATYKLYFSVSCVHHVEMLHFELPFRAPFFEINPMNCFIEFFIFHVFPAGDEGLEEVVRVASKPDVTFVDALLSEVKTELVSSFLTK